MSVIVNTPDASRLIHGMRDTGYDSSTAVADIVDNSIAAGADNINIAVELLHDGRKIVYIGDDGCGMDLKGVQNAMRYGSDQRPDLKSLGKFGLGLKTASSSVCKRFSLLSRSEPGKEIVKATWDLDHVAAKNAWEMLAEPVSPDEAETFDDLCGKTGTMVIWERCDRLLSRDFEPGAREKAAVNRVVENICKHLGLVFHRFLDAEDSRERNVNLRINGEAIVPWNPLYPARSEQVLGEASQKLVVEWRDGREGSATMKAWILPHRNQMTKTEHDQFARISNKGQGFYVYREGRLISAGGWMGVFGSPEPHFSLLRIEFDFDHKLDDAFKIDVMKSRIQFHPNLEESLKELLQPAYREAGTRYRRQNRNEIDKSGVIDHAGANKSIADTANTVKPRVESVDVENQTAEIDNNRGPSIRIKMPIYGDASPESIHVEGVTTITNGHLWEPSLRNSGSAGYVPAVLINTHHDFYQKIYQRAKANGYAVDGLDLLLYAFALAEINNTDSDLEPIFEDIREEVSSNLKKLLRSTPAPTPAELAADSGAGE